MQRAAYTVWLQCLLKSLADPDPPVQTPQRPQSSLPYQKHCRKKFWESFQEAHFIYSFVKRGLLGILSYRQTSMVSMVNDVDAEDHDHYDGECCQVLSSMMIWYDMIWFDIWYDIWSMIWYDMVRYIWSIIWYDMICFDTYGVWYDMIWFDIYGVWYIWYDMEYDDDYFECFQVWSSAVDHHCGEVRRHLGQRAPGNISI